MQWSNTEWGWNGAIINTWAKDNDRPDITVEQCIFTSISCGGNEGQGSGGAICVKNGRLNMTTCEFTTCVAVYDGGAVFVEDTDMSATGCHFVTCSAGGEGGALAVSLTNQRALVFTNCEVRDCAAAGSSVLFFDAIGSATFEDNTIENCSSNGGLVLQMVCQSFTWIGNTFDLSISNDSASVIQVVRDGDGDRLIENSHFYNDGKQVNRFFDLNRQGAWKFDNCSFTGIQTPEESGEGAAIYLPDQGVTELEVVDCKFRDLACRGNGGAIHVRHIHFTLTRCRFENCESRVGYVSGNQVKLGGSGGVYIEKNARGEIEGCIFVNNTAAINGQSLQIMIAFDAQEIPVTVSNCTFSDHKSPSVLCFSRYGDAYDATLADCPFKYTIFNCTFEDNVLDSSDLGLVLAKSTDGLSYEYCIFRGNQGKLVSVSNVESGSPSCDLSNCSFENCDGTGLVFARQGIAVGAISFETCDFKSCDALIVELQSTGTSLTLSGCSFEECQASGDNGLISIAGNQQQDATLKISACSFTDCSSCVTKVQAVVAKLEILDSHFTKCGSGTSSSSSVVFTDENSAKEVAFSRNTVSDCTAQVVLAIHSESVSFSENSFTLNSNSAAIVMYVTKPSTVQDTLFNVAAANTQSNTDGSPAIIRLSCGQDAQIDFYNCCFTHSEADQNLGSYYIAMNNIESKVVFSDVCFDVEESQAIDYGTGKDNVEFSGGNRDGFFVDCECWEPVKTAGPPTDEDTYDPTSEVDDQGTSEVDDQGTSEVDDQGTSEVDDQGTSEVDDQGTSEVDDQGTSEVDDQGTSEVDDQGTSEVDDQGTSEVDDLPPSASETDDRHSETPETKDPGSDSGDDDKTNAGLIAGAVTGVIVVVAVVVVVIILLLRRRSSGNDDDSMSDDQELTEETIASSSEIDITTGGIKTTNEEPPIFANPLREADEHDFDSVFEEDEIT